MVGIAREVAALTGKKVRYPDGAYDEAGGPIAERVSVEIADDDLCSRYVATAHRRREAGRLAAVDAGAADRGRHAADQQHRRHHELRDAGAGAAAARLRLHAARRRQDRRAAGAAGREADDARRRRPRAVAGHARHRRRDGRRCPRRRDGRREQRGARGHADGPAGVGELRPGEHPAHQHASQGAQRGVESLREGTERRSWRSSRRGAPRS